MTIIKYEMNRNIDIQFKDGTIIHNTCYDSFKKGNIKNYNYPDIYGVGYFGYGKYSYKEHTIVYNTWMNMLKRCYDLKYQENKPTYLNCVVCKEWHNFQNFADWYEKSYYSIPNCKMQLDKDILVKGNKIYSLENCCFVPSEINAVFTKREAERGNLPIGVNEVKGRYKACFTRNKQITYLGYYDTPLEAFQIYKFAKEQYIKLLANKYIKYLPNNLYNALMNYQVEIDD